MVFKVNFNDEVLMLFYKHSPSDWPIIINSSSIMHFSALCLVTHLSEPRFGVFLHPDHLVVLAVQLPQDFDHFALYLKFGLSCHEGGEGHTAEVTTHANLRSTVG